MALSDTVAQHVLGELQVLTKQIDEQVQRIYESKRDFEGAANNVNETTQKAELRAEAMYGVVLEASAHLKQNLDQFSASVTDAADGTTEQLIEVQADTGKVVAAMVTIHEMVGGERGLRAQLESMEASLTGKIWTLDKCIADIQAVQHSGPARHAVAVVAVVALALVFVSMTAGVAIGATDQARGALTVGVIGIMGLLVGWLGAWVMNDRAARKATP